MSGSGAVTGLVHGNPEIANDPIAANGLLSVQGASGLQLGAASHFLNAYGQIADHADSAVRSEHAPARAWWQKAFHDGADIWDHVRHAVSSGYDFAGQVGSTPSTFTDVLNIPEKVTNWALGTVAEGAKGLVTHPGEIRHRFSTDWDAANATVAGLQSSIVNSWQNSLNNNQLALDVSQNGVRGVLPGLAANGRALASSANNVNPFNPDFWNKMAHAGAMFASTARQKGLDYALAQWAPIVAGSLATHSAVFGEAGAGEAAGEFADIQQAQEETTSARVAAAKAERLAERGKTFRAASTTAQVISSPLKAFTALSRILMAPGADLRLNMMYAMAESAFSNDPEARQLWEQTRGGFIVNPEGQAVQTVGQGLVSALGLNQDDPFSKLLGGATTIYAQTMGSDPLGALGEVVGRARSAQGLGGILGSYFGGTLIQAPEDVYRVYEQYPQAQTAVNFMASHDSGAILREFPSWFKGESGKRFLAALSEVHTPAEVLDVLAEAAELGTLKAPTMPMMSTYKAAFSLLKDTDFAEGVRRGVFMTAKTKYLGDVLASDSILLGKMKEGIENNTPFKLSDDTKNVYATGVGTEAANIRLRSTFGQWLGRQLGAKGWMITRGLSTEGHIIELGDKAAGVLLAANIREAGMPGKIASAVESMWVDANEAQRQAIIDNINFHLLARTILAGMPEEVYAHFGEAIDQLIREQIPEQSGASRAGESGSMLSGPQIDRSYAGGKAAALDSTQLGKRFLIDTQSARRAALTIRDLVLKATDNYNAEIGALEKLDEISIENIARTRRASLGDLQLRVSGLFPTFEGAEAFTGKEIPRAPETIIGHNAKLLYESYTKERDLLQQELKDVVDEFKGEKVAEHQAFAKFYTQVRDDFQRTLTITTLGQEALKARQTLGEDSEVYKRLVQELDDMLPHGSFKSVTEISNSIHTTLVGEREALADVLATMNAQLQDQAISFDKLTEHVKSLQESETAITEEQAKKLASEYEAQRSKKRLFSNSWHTLNSATNWYISRIWSPAALTSAGWAMRVATSETLLNTYRIGARDALRGRIITSIVKHEMGGGEFSRMAEKLISDKVMQGRVLGGTFMDMVRSNELNAGEKMVGAAVRGLVATILEAREALGGALHGIESSLITMDARTERMIENFTEAWADFDGHLPMQIHGGAQIIDNQILKYGNDANGNPMLSHAHVNGSYSSISAGDNKYPEALRRAITGLYVGPEFKVATQEMTRVLATRGMEGLSTEEIEALGLNGIIARGSESVKTNKDVEDLINEIRPKVQEHLQGMESGHKDLFERNSVEGKVDKTAEEILTSLSKDERSNFLSLSKDEREKYVRDWNWADHIAYHAVHTVHGTTEGGEIVMHPDLIEQAYTGEIGTKSDYKQMVDKMEADNHTAPQYLSSSTGGQPHWTDALIRSSDLAHKYVLGPIVNAMVRDPLYLIEFDREMENLYQAHGALMNRDEMKLMAYQTAMERMVKYVHNPLDKAVFESRTRALFPFWFAQNQAWRRALRLMATDPGAFEKLMRTYLLITNSISTVASTGNLPILTMPSEMLPQWVQSTTTSYFDPKGLGNLDFKIGADLSSVSSIDPMGSVAGMGILENIVRPSGGPLWTALGDVAGLALNYLSGAIPGDNKASRSRLINDTIANILGPAATYNLSQGTAGLMREAVPATQVNNIIQDVEAWLSNPTKIQNDSFNSVQNAVLKNAQDNLQKQWYDSYYKQDIKAGASPQNAQNYAFVMSMRMVQKLLNPELHPVFSNNFMATVHTQAATLYTWKTALSLVSPVPLTLQDAFSKEPEYQALLDEKLPNGQPRYSAIEAMNIFTTKYPTHSWDLISQTASASPQELTAGEVGPTYSETSYTANWISSNPELQQQFPNASAIYSYSTGNYSGAAAVMEKQMQLRTVESTQQLLTRSLQMAGDDFYYDVLMKVFPDVNGEQGYQNYLQRTKYLDNYAKLENPIWGAYYNSGQDGKKLVDNSTAQQVLETAGYYKDGTFIPNKNWPDSVFGGITQREHFAQIASYYQEALANYNAAPTKKDAYAISSSWYNNCTLLMSETGKDGAPVYSPQVQKFLEILRTLPGK